MDSDKIYKLHVGLSAYMPGDIDYLPRATRENIYETKLQEYYDDYEAYYIEQIEEMFHNFEQKVLFTPYVKSVFYNLLSNELYKFEANIQNYNIIRRFEWKLEEKSDNEFKLYLYDYPRTIVEKRSKIFIITYNNDGDIKIKLVEDTY